MDESERLGLQSEANVGRALRQMLLRGDVDGFYRTRKHSAEDNAGIDFVVTYREQAIPLQVKSSECGLLNHFYKRGRSIPCVIGQGDNLIPRIKRALRDFLSPAQDQEVSA